VGEPFCISAKTRPPKVKRGPKETQKHHKFVTTGGREDYGPDRRSNKLALKSAVQDGRVGTGTAGAMKKANRYGSMVELTKARYQNRNMKNPGDK